MTKKFYHVVEDACYQRLTHGLAIPNFCRQYGFECHTYSDFAWQNGQIETDSSPDAVFLIEQAFHEKGNWTVERLRQRVPNGKIVVFGGDTIYFLANSKSLGFQPREVDLWLDTMQSVSHLMRDIGVKSDVWWWTISEEYAKRCEAFVAKSQKHVDAICLMTANTPYRNNLMNFFRQKNRHLICGHGVLSSEDNILFSAYAESWVALGTTSPAWTDNIRTMKGFRDWIAPFLGTVLIYDNHPQLANWADFVLFYHYDNFEAILEIIDMLKSNESCYRFYLEKQKASALANSLEKQYFRLFKAHGII